MHVLTKMCCISDFRERIMASSKERPVNDCFVFVHAEKFISTTSSQTFLLQIGKKQYQFRLIQDKRPRLIM